VGVDVIVGAGEWVGVAVGERDGVAVAVWAGTEVAVAVPMGREMTQLTTSWGRLEAASRVVKRILVAVPPTFWIFTP
jgi:hypothetical protein